MGDRPHDEIHASRKAALASQLHVGVSNCLESQALTAMSGSRHCVFVRTTGRDHELGRRDLNPISIVTSSAVLVELVALAHPCE